MKGAFFSLFCSRLLIFFLVVCTSGIVISGCNRPLDRMDPQVTTNNQKPTVPVYPHSADFKAKHGSFYRAEKTQCLSCHGADLSGGNSKVSCSQCHENFPHPAGWALPSRHSEIYLASSSKEKCLACHQDKSNSGAANSSGGPSGKVTCQECHQAYPHSAEFKLGKGDHKLLAKSESGKCLACHTRENAPGSESKKKSCTQCHNYPHKSDWGTPAQHGVHFANAKEPERKRCLSCHLEDQENPDKKLSVTCKQCHMAYPHVVEHPGIPDEASHEAKCFACHVNGKKNTPNMTEGCNDCHAGTKLIYFPKVEWVTDPQAKHSAKAPNRLPSSKKKK